MGHCVKSVFILHRLSNIHAAERKSLASQQLKKQNLLAKKSVQASANQRNVGLIRDRPAILGMGEGASGCGQLRSLGAAAHLGYLPFLFSTTVMALGSAEIKRSSFPPGWFGMPQESVPC